MGQKVNPHGLRVGVIKDWDSSGMLKLILLTIWLRITRSEHTLRRNYTAPVFPRLRSSAHLIE